MSNSSRDPRANAAAYRQEHDQDEPPAPSAHPASQRTPERWTDLISQRIEEAMREGKFDNLPGRSKALTLGSDPHTSPEMQMANSLLKNNNLAPAWIADRSEILADIERFRHKLRQATAGYQQANTAEARACAEQRWQAQLLALQEDARTLNRRIEVQNLKQPVTFLEIAKVRLDDEIRRIMGE